MQARTFLLLSVLAAACGGDPQTPSELDQSRETFEAQTADTGDYDYVRHFASWTGYWSRTSFEVRGGEVVTRSFESGEGEGAPTTTWTETGEELGTHEGAHPVATMLDLYDQCATEILTVDPEQNDIALELDDDGFLKTCTFTPYNCEDDCTSGIEIESIQLELGCGVTADCG